MLRRRMQNQSRIQRVSVSGVHRGGGGGGSPNFNESILMRLRKRYAGAYAGGGGGAIPHPATWANSCRGMGRIWTNYL